MAEADVIDIIAKGIWNEAILAHIGTHVSGSHSRLRSRYRDAHFANDVTEFPRM